MKDGSGNSSAETSSEMNSFNRDFSELMTELKENGRCSSRISGHSSIILGDEEFMDHILEDSGQNNQEQPSESIRSINSSSSRSSYTSSNEGDEIIDNDDEETGSKHNENSYDKDSTLYDVDMTASCEPHVSINSQQEKRKMIPMDIVWEQGGDKVYVTGSFTGWTKMIGLLPIPNKAGMLHVRLKLPPGVHRFRFIVDNELRYSDYLPTATDQMGNFVNYLEIRATDSTEFTSYLEDHISAQAKKMSAQSRIALKIKTEPDNVGDGFTRFYNEDLEGPDLEFSNKLPAVFTDPRIMEKYYMKLDYERSRSRTSSLLPAQLPPHLEHAILNEFPNTASTTNEIAHGGSLSTPNHVVLNHLLTSSVRHSTLGLATAVRYKDKYITQVYYSPIKK